MQIQGAANGRRVHTRNKKWVAGQSDAKNGRVKEGERWERGGHRRRGGGRGRGGFTGLHDAHLTVPSEAQNGDVSGADDDGVSAASAAEEDLELAQPEPEMESQEEADRIWLELIEAREEERKTAIAEGRMDDPHKSKRLADAITLVGTCMDMCPKHERYRREHEHNLDKWEVIPGTKRVDHARAVKKYERGAGDKVVPSDLRPPPVLKRTLDYLFHDLVAREGFEKTFSFVRDRSRAARNDCTIQLQKGPLAIECHERCARYHTVALHLARKCPSYDQGLEVTQLQNCLTSLKEFYDDEVNASYRSPAELEMRVYRRLLMIRADDRDVIPERISEQPIFKLATQFRDRVRELSQPIKRASKLVVDDEAMQMFSKLAAIMREENNFVMLFLVGCLMQFHFGTECIDNIDSLRGDLSVVDIIDGVSSVLPAANGNVQVESPASMTGEATEIEGEEEDEEEDEEGDEDQEEEPIVLAPSMGSTQPLAPSATEWLTSNFSSAPSTSQSAFSGHSALPPSSTFTTSGFAGLGTKPSGSFSSSTSAPPSVFSNLTTSSSVFGGASFGSKAASSFSSSVSSAPAASPHASLNPFAPSFTPTPAAASAFAATSAFAPRPPQPPPPTEKPSIFGFSTTSPAPPTSSFASGGIFGAPLEPPAAAPPPSIPLHVSAQIPSAPPTNAPSPFTLQGSPSREPVSRDETLPIPPPETPSRIIERRQTLWDLPGSSSPFHRLKEDRMTFTPQPGSSVEPRTPISPTAPPPALGRFPTMALPPTPTARWFESAPGQAEESDITLSRKRSLLHFPSLTSVAPSQPDILSPIHLTAPALEKTALGVNAAPSPLSRSHIPPASSAHASSSASAAPVPLTPTTPVKTPTTSKKPVLEIQTNGFSPSPSLKGKERETRRDVDAVAAEPLEVRASRFLSTSRLVRKCWETWRRRREATNAWAEACRRSESYKEQVQRARLASSVNGDRAAAAEQSQKRRRSSLPAETPQMRRNKRRKSSQFVQPLTDEALAERLLKNHEENEKRWAQGSFLQTVVDRLKAQLADGAELPGWSVWLSMNTENDNTAIWLEHKFDVPSSGDWLTKNVFSIPVFKKKGKDSPGLIVFECTPLEGAEDEIERKYRVIDDCARLRDVLDSLPVEEERHFLPCLVIISWSETDGGNDAIRDLVDMTQKIVRDGTIKHVSYFSVSVTAKELDKKFAAIVDVTPLDIEDRLLMAFGAEDVETLFVSPTEAAISDMLDSCWPDDEFDWARYERVMASSEVILDAALRAVLGLFDSIPSHVSVEMPEMDPHPATSDQPPTYYADLLLAHLRKSIKLLLDSRLASPVTLSSDLVDFAVYKLEKAINTEAEKLRQYAADRLAAAAAALRTSTGPSPKRRPSDEDELRLDGSYSSKRFRASSPEGAAVGTETAATSVSPPPSTSALTDSGEKPVVTVAMLRALTRDVLKTCKK